MPQDPAIALCEALSQFITDWKDSIVSLGREFAQEAMVEDLHQLTALVGAWERAKERTQTQQAIEQHIQRAQALHNITPNLSIIEALDLTRTITDSPPCVNYSTTNSVEPNPPHPIDNENHPHNL